MQSGAPHFLHQSTHIANCPLCSVNHVGRNCVQNIFHHLSIVLFFVFPLFCYICIFSVLRHKLHFSFAPSLFSSQNMPCAPFLTYVSFQWSTSSHPLKTSQQLPHCHHHPTCPASAVICYLYNFSGESSYLPVLQVPFFVLYPMCVWWNSKLV